MKKTSAPHHRRRHRYLLVATTALAAGILPFPAVAQTTPKPLPRPAEDTVTLSPFTVNSTKDVGYMANSTLAGSRTNTEIKDIANPLDIFTVELLQDLAVCAAGQRGISSACGCQGLLFWISKCRPPARWRWFGASKLAAYLRMPDSCLFAA